MNASSIWRKDLRPYINCNNCHFGNQKPVSFCLRISTESKANSYTIGSWVQENWATAIKANVFHDSIQEGGKIQVACLSNIADITQYRDLQLNVEAYINEEYLAIHNKHVQERLQNITSDTEKNGEAT